MFAPEDILYEDNHLLIVNKRCGDLVQPDPSGDDALERQRKEFIRREECTTCASSLSQRVSAVESGLDSLPTSESWGKMQVAIEEVRGSNRVVLAKLEGQSELLKRIEHPMQLLMEHHLRGEK